MSIDARLQVKVAEILRNQLKQPARQGRGRGDGPGHRRPAGGGELPAAGRWRRQPTTKPMMRLSGSRALRSLSAGLDLQSGDRHGGAAQGPGPRHRRRTSAIRLPDGRVGNFVKGFEPADPRRRAGHDAARHASIWSTAWWFRATPTSRSWAPTMWARRRCCDTANLLGIAAASPNTAAQLRKSLPQSSYGQGQVVASPFQMARVAATVANGGAMPQGRWITDENNARTSAPAADPAGAEAASTLGRFMREVVTSGTGRRAAASVRGGRQDGHRGTGRRAVARLVHRLRAVRRATRKIAFSVLVENGVYGGRLAAPAAAGDRQRGSQTGADSGHEPVFRNREDHRARISRWTGAHVRRRIPTNCCWCIARFWRRSKARCRPSPADAASSRSRTSR